MDRGLWTACNSMNQQLVNDGLKDKKTREEFKSCLDRWYKVLERVNSVYKEEEELVNDRH